MTWQGGGRGQKIRFFLLEMPTVGVEGEDFSSFGDPQGSQASLRTKKCPYLTVGACPLPCVQRVGHHMLNACPDSGSASFPEDAQ